MPLNDTILSLRTLRKMQKIQQNQQRTFCRAPLCSLDSTQGELDTIPEDAIIKMIGRSTDEEESWIHQTPIPHRKNPRFSPIRLNIRKNIKNMDIGEEDDEFETEPRVRSPRKRRRTTIEIK